MLLVGRALLVIALAIAFYGVFASLYGVRLRDARAGGLRGRAWIDSGRRAVYALTGTVAVCFLVLEVAFLRSDFSFELVATHSSTTTPAFYRATAAWSSQEGSLLLWVMLLSGWSSLILYLTRRRAREIAPYATAVLLGLAAFFLGLLVFLETPFARASPVPAEGAGLNPILRHPAMMIHPPMLYSGYTLFAVPFAFGIAALVTRRLGTDWIRTTRPFALAAWLCLGVGVILGARWSYSELGWGGYWAWDGVENAALMPWLTGTAFLHSVMIQERRGMLKMWNVSLVLATGILAVLGTFLVRSGILESIHAFGASTLGIPFLVLIVTMLVASIVLVATRAGDLRSEHRLDSLLSREAVFLLNNLVLVALCFVIFWGTFFPLISEAVTGKQASVGPPWFGRYVVPLALVLVLLSGLGPVMAWRRATAANLRRVLAVPVAAAAVTLVALLAVGDVARRPLAVAMFCLAAFALAVVAQEFWRGVRARRAMSDDSVPRALVSLVRRNRRRYGGYLVHAGIAVLFVGVAASTAFQDVRDVRLAPGERARVAGYEITYVRPTGGIDVAPNGSLEKIDLGAALRVRRGGGEPIALHPERSYFPSSDPSLGAVSRYFEGEATSEVGLESGLRRDFWTVVSPDIRPLIRIARRGDEVFRRAASLPREQRAVALGETLRRMVTRYGSETAPATFRVLVSPLVMWVWLGALIVFAGGLVALWPAPAGARSRARAGYAARVARELGRA
ncbi:MAG: heme lyase CcmF/NrfE family subunit [Thermoleophilaceae bacterium]|nr:heme lyase CcmF/NrfE family subunit [Thermoleophilaceae bacterium]